MGSADDLRRSDPDSALPGHEISYSANPWLAPDKCRWVPTEESIDRNRYLTEAEKRGNSDILVSFFSQV